MLSKLPLTLSRRPKEENMIKMLKTKIKVPRRIRKTHNKSYKNKLALFGISYRV